MKTTSLIAGLLLLTLNSFAQKKQFDLQSLFKEKKLTAYNRNISSSADKKTRGINLDENSGEGIVWLNDVTFSTGTLDIDLRGKDAFQKSFLGLAFHASNDSTYDAIYFRPFNFHATDSVRKIHAVQYISHPIYTWKKLREERNGTYEKALVNPPDPNAWFHARIEVTDDEVQVYVNDDTVPSLTIKKISAVKGGKVGLWTGESSGGEFANLQITKK